MQLFWNSKSLEDNYRKNAINLQRLRRNMKKFNCINDNLSHKDNEGLVENKIFSKKVWLRNLPWQSVDPENGNVNGHFRTVISVRSFPKKEPNFQWNKIRGQHIVLFDSFMKASSQAKVNLKYKFYSSSTFLFCTKMSVRAIRMLYHKRTTDKILKKISCL